MSYNPFNKPLGVSLTEDDLLSLITNRIPEGFFIEYKGELPAERQKISKTIASLANTYGGWYIVGIKTDDHNVANELCGFDAIDGNKDPISSITENLKCGIDPVPVFHAQAIRLASGKLAVAVFVPRDQATPFITRDGRIYRRNHDSSSPVPETSRHTLDELVSRGRARGDAFRIFSDSHHHIPNSWKYGAVHISISPFPHGVVNKQEHLSEAHAEALLADSRKPISIGEPFPQFFHACRAMERATVHYDSIVLEEGRHRGSPSQGCRILLDAYGRCKITIPLRGTLGDLAEVFDLTSRDCKDEMVNLFDIGQQPKFEDFSSFRFFNIGSLWLEALWAVGFYQRWLAPEAPIDGFALSAHADNVALHVPLIDHKEWALLVQKFGLPICRNKHVKVPPSESDSWRAPAGTVLPVQVCAMLANAFGLPPEVYARTIFDLVLDAAKSTAGSESNASTQGIDGR